LSILQKTSKGNPMVLYRKGKPGGSEEVLEVESGERKFVNEPTQMTQCISSHPPVLSSSF
jgi:hypothetical protein